MKIEYKNHLNAASEILARDIPIDTVFTGRIGNMNHSIIDIYLRAYAVIVSISNPTRTWIFPDAEQWTQIVYEYQVVDAKVVVE